MDLWRAFELPAEETRLFQVAARRFWVRRRSDEWYVATDLEPARLGVDETVQLDVVQDKPAALPWQRWGISTDSNRFSLLPVMPDRPLVVRPEAPMRIQSGCEYRFFVGIPVWLRLAVGLAKDHVLGEWPTQVLSKTWMGDPVEGELCYAVKTFAHRSPTQFAPRANRAVCPVRISNRAVGDLAFERVCIHGDNLALYDGGTHLWSSETSLIYQGLLHSSHSEAGQGAPPEANQPRELSPPRIRLTDNALRRSFSTIRAIAEQPLWRL